jgi:hypothetical protein
VKIRRIAPLMITATGVATLVGMQATPALATTHNDKCTGAGMCLWYSAGIGSGIWEGPQSVVWSNYSYDFLDVSGTPHYDHYVNGNGSGQGVRNNAHSAAGIQGNYIYSLPDLKGLSAGVGGSTAALLPSSVRNNNASEKSSGCTAVYQGHGVC